MGTHRDFFFKADINSERRENPGGNFLFWEAECAGLGKVGPRESGRGTPAGGSREPGRRCPRAGGAEVRGQRVAFPTWGDLGGEEAAFPACEKREERRRRH